MKLHSDHQNDSVASLSLFLSEQIVQIEEFVMQINEAATPNSSLIVMGDANLCALKWLKDDYERKSVAQLLLQCLEQNGFSFIHSFIHHYCNPGSRFTKIYFHSFLY